jgi:hypothetical protein
LTRWASEVGKYVTELPEGLAPLGPAASLGLLHFEQGQRFGFYYLLTRAAKPHLSANTLLRPLLDIHLFVRSFQVTGTDDPLLRTQGLLRFLSFTAQFIQHEYDPLALAQTG